MEGKRFSLECEPTSILVRSLVTMASIYHSEYHSFDFLFDFIFLDKVIRQF